MRLYVLGHGVQHSLSPATWNGVFGALGLDWHYDLWDTDPDGLPAVLAEVRDPEVRGFNVTMPYKGWAYEQAARRSRDAERAQVANWLFAQGADLAAANTDIEGARALLDDIPAPDRVVVLGAGGTASAMLVALSGQAGSVVVANRTHERAVALAERASGWLGDVVAVPWERRAEIVSRADLIVNTTPLGMGAGVSPLEGAEFRDGARLYDVVYSSGLTALQRQAGGRGLPIADGLAHLEAQAVALVPHLELPGEATQLVSASLARAAGRAPYRWDVPTVSREPSP